MILNQIDDALAANAASGFVPGHAGDAGAFRHTTEDALALAFATSAEGKVMFDHSDNNWFIWDGHRWVRDEVGRTFQLARELVRKTSQSPFILPKEKDKLQSVQTTRNLLSFAKNDERIATHSAAWDLNPWLLATPDGVIDLRTAEMSPGKPSDRITKQTSVAPAPPGTPAPMWQAFLKQATGDDDELIAFLQRLAGYVMTGDVTEEMLAFIYGPGGNGKGVYISTISGILADYAVAMPMEAFITNSKAQGEYYRARMAGARLVTASETEAGTTWAEAQIKELTGNETKVSARQPYGKVYEYRPVAKLVFVGNHAPRLKSRTPAMEQRLRIVPFNQSPAQADPDLKDRLRAEYPAILRWMLDGCLAWQQQRLGTSAAVAQETSGYFEKQDSFKLWLAEGCILAPELQTKPGHLFTAYKNWCAANGEDVPTANEFAEIIDRTDGLSRKKITGTRYVRGIGLRNNTDDAF